MLGKWEAVIGVPQCHYITSGVTWKWFTSGNTVVLKQRVWGKCLGSCQMWCHWGCCNITGNPSIPNNSPADWQLFFFFLFFPRFSGVCASFLQEEFLLDSGTKQLHNLKGIHQPLFKKIMIGQKTEFHILIVLCYCVQNNLIPSLIISLSCSYRRAATYFTFKCVVSISGVGKIS